MMTTHETKGKITMSTELIAIISIGIALAGLMLNGQHNLQKEMQAQRAETRAEFQVVREETQAEFQAVREEMHAEFQAQREAIIGLLERVARLEGVLDGLREAIVGRRAADAEAANSGQP